MIIPEPISKTAPVHTEGRPYPWFCPNCRRKEVRPATVAYECQRFHNGQPVNIVVRSLLVPKCDQCGELVFTYDTEDQINRAFRAQTEGLQSAVTMPTGTEIGVPKCPHS